ncbi:divergent protein kinase domain 2A [Halictus rubicundus]|uniref:divergent protein kinase domain 2A n=1 Tax=Halictus rubicundus TaxID=77578 RepID=UPI004036991D
MILSYLYNILKFKKWELFVIVVVIIAIKWSKIITFRPDINHLTELHKCPACFGTSACDYIHKVDVTPYNLYSMFSYFFGVKNVFFGRLNDNNIVLKKLARSFELNKFDQMLCQNKNFFHICASNLREATNAIDNVDFYELIKQEVTLDFTKDNLSRLRVCPTEQRLSNLLQQVYRNNQYVDKQTLDINIWTSIVLNPEPLLLQILSTEENWPVPRYLGACGRIILEEYVGLPLINYYYKPWLLRAKLTSSLLNSAYIFTFQSSDFAFYLTDVSADNIAVDSNNNVKFIDLENVIVVDKNFVPEEELETWNQLQENNENFSCSKCLIYSSADICSHRISDHNYYAICKMLLEFDVNDNLLSGEFLHNIPANIQEAYPNIHDLIKECVTPKKPLTRIIAGIQLKELLDTIIKDKNTDTD